VATRFKFGTFNAENLFLRYEFNKRGQNKIKETLNKEELTIGDFKRELVNFKEVPTIERELTKLVITENKPDILAMVEVESLETLKKFNKNYLNGFYNYMMLIEGNDIRGINLGIYSKDFPIGNIRTHQFEYNSLTKGKLFSRDCLEVELNVWGSILTILINHFKSKIESNKNDINTAAKLRKKQAKRVSEILVERFGNKLDRGDFIVCGDLNSNPDEDPLSPLLSLKNLENVVERLPKDDRWTYWWDKKNQIGQFDYILLSPSLSNNNPTSKPFIERRGMPKINACCKEKRFEIGQTKEQSASDHCPVYIELKI